MNERKYQLMEQHLKGELTVINMIDRIVELEGGVKTETPERTVAEYVIANKDDVEQVVDTLMAAVDKYGQITVGDYLDLIGVPSTYKHHKCGWTASSLRKIRYVRTHNGYVIQFPSVEVF